MMGRFDRLIIVLTLLSCLFGNSMASPVTHYYYRQNQISAINQDSRMNSFMLIDSRLAKRPGLGRGKNQPFDVSKMRFMQIGQQTAYYLGDRKNITLSIDQSLVGGQDYQGYGQIISGLSWSSVDSFGYNREYQDPLTRLMYLRARDYDARHQHFVSMDSYHVWNKYNFADANPISNIDPTGHWSTPVNHLAGIGSMILALIFAVAGKKIAENGENFITKTPGFMLGLTAVSLAVQSVNFALPKPNTAVAVLAPLFAVATALSALVWYFCPPFSIDVVEPVPVRRVPVRHEAGQNADFGDLQLVLDGDELANNPGAAAAAA